MAFTPEELERHSRHILLKEIGGPGLAKLRSARISIIGAGALGGPCALYLAAAGVGAIHLVDDDRVDLSNLQRQIQFGTGDIGQSKTSQLRQRLLDLDPQLTVEVTPRRYEVGDPLAGDILIDATDNFETRFALNDTAHSTARPLVSGAATGWQGQVSVFTSGRDPGTPCYRCLVPDTPPDAMDCEEMGVVGAVTGIVGARMALETIKLITGAGEPLISKLWIFDGLSGRGRVATLARDPTCRTCGQ